MAKKNTTPAAVESAALPEPEGASRRRPAQQRSRDRHDRILQAAAQLIADKGSDNVKMSDVAVLAGTSIGSLYQYFPDKSAIIRALAERHYAFSRACIADALAKVHDLAALRAAFASLIDQYDGMIRSEPVIGDIWSAMQTDKQLAAIDADENRANGALLAQAMQRAHPKRDKASVAMSAFLIWQLSEFTARLTVTLPPRDGRALLETFKAMADRELAMPDRAGPKAGR